MYASMMAALWRKGSDARMVTPCHAGGVCVVTVVYYLLPRPPAWILTLVASPDPTRRMGRTSKFV